MPRFRFTHEGRDNTGGCNTASHTQTRYAAHTPPSVYQNKLVWCTSLLPPTPRCFRSYSENASSLRNPRLPTRVHHPRNNEAVSPRNPQLSADDSFFCLLEIYQHSWSQSENAYSSTDRRSLATASPLPMATTSSRERRGLASHTAQLSTAASALRKSWENPQLRPSANRHNRQRSIPHQTAIGATNHHTAWHAGGQGFESPQVHNGTRERSRVFLFSPPLLRS